MHSKTDTAVTPDHITDVTTLVRRAADGDHRSWEAIVARFSGLVHAVALQHRIGHADAADVAQATWLQLFEHIDQIRQPERLGAWLATTARREALRVVAHRGRVELHSGAAVFDEVNRLQAPLDEALLAEERRHLVRSAVQTLPSAWQPLMGLLMLDPPMSYQQIAAELDLPVGSIGPTRRRCMSRMRTALDAA